MFLPRRSRGKVLLLTCVTAWKAIETSRASDALCLTAKVTLHEHFISSVDRLDQPQVDRYLTCVFGAPDFLPRKTIGRADRDRAAWSSARLSHDGCLDRERRDHIGSFHLEDHFARLS